MAELGPVVDIPDGALLKVEQVAVILGLDVGSVRRLIRRGVIPARHIGRRLYVLGADLKRVGVTEVAAPEPAQSEPEPEPVKPKAVKVTKQAKVKTAGRGGWVPRVIGLD